MRIVYVSKLDGFFKTRIQKEKKTISLNQFAKKKGFLGKILLTFF